jgi:ribonuclease E
VIAQVPVEVATFLMNEKRDALATIEEKASTDIVLVPNPNMLTPNYVIRRVRDDETQLAENVGVSYQLATPAEEPAAATEAAEGRDKKPVPQPAVVPMLAATSSPMPAAPAAEQAPAPVKPGIFVRLWRALFGKGEPVPSHAERPGRPHRRDREEGHRREGGRFERHERHGGRERHERHPDRGRLHGQGRRPHDRGERHPRDAGREGHREQQRERERPPQATAGTGEGPAAVAREARPERPQGTEQRGLDRERGERGERGERRGRRRRGGRRGRRDERAAPAEGAGPESRPTATQQEIFSPPSSGTGAGDQGRSAEQSRPALEERPPEIAPPPAPAPREPAPAPAEHKSYVVWSSGPADSQSDSRRDDG